MLILEAGITRLPPFTFKMIARHDCQAIMGEVSETIAQVQTSSHDFFKTSCSMQGSAAWTLYAGFILDAGEAG